MDGALSMKGKDIGVWGKFSRDYPYILFTHDFSHVYNLVFEKALVCFPKNIMNVIISKISSSF